MSFLDKPVLAEIPEYYHRYAQLAVGDDLFNALRAASVRTHAIIDAFSVERHEHRYAEGKWSVKEVVQHVVDCERIFAYRALRFARNDATGLPGFDENRYAPEARSAARTMAAILCEHDAVRNATLELFMGLDNIALMRSGSANNLHFSVRGLGWITAGHAIHHVKTIEERYVK